VAVLYVTWPWCVVCVLLRYQVHVFPCVVLLMCVLVAARYGYVLCASSWKHSALTDTPKLSHYTPRRHLGEKRYSSYSFSTSALDGDEWSASRPGRALAPGLGHRYPLYRRLGGPQLVWTQRLEEKSFRLCRESNLDRPVVQPVARHYTDWATRLTTDTLPAINPLNRVFAVVEVSHCPCNVTRRRAVGLATGVRNLFATNRGQRGRSVKLTNLVFMQSRGSEHFEL
jgi:hypothetical protein